MRDVGSAVIAEIYRIARWEKLLKKYGADLIETMALGFVLTASEDWSGVDRRHARELVDDALRAAQETRARTGAEQISLDDVDNRLTVMTMGLATGAPEAAAARGFLFSQPPYERVQHFAPLLIKMGEALAQVKGRHAAAFEQAQEYAWRIGVGLGLLSVVGEVPAQDDWAGSALT